MIRCLLRIHVALTGCELPKTGETSCHIGRQRSESHTSEMTGDVISFGAGSSTILPLASKAEVICALPSDVIVAKMVVQCLRVGERLDAINPKTFMA